MTRWLATYIDKDGAPRAAIITPDDAMQFPFGVDEFSLGLDNYDGLPVTLVDLPADYRPAVVDVDSDAELALQFIDL